MSFRLYTASRLITQAYHPYLSELGLTYPQYLVMMVLWEKDRMPVNDIAKRLLLDGQEARFVKLQVNSAVGGFGSGRELFFLKKPGTDGYRGGVFNERGEAVESL